jgi:hypothetical protein
MYYYQTPRWWGLVENPVRPGGNVRQTVLPASALNSYARLFLTRTAATGKVRRDDMTLFGEQRIRSPTCGPPVGNPCSISSSDMSILRASR